MSFLNIKKNLLIFLERERKGERVRERGREAVPFIYALID